MGIAEVVPGVSGGTIAFVTGIYDELIHTLASFRPASLRLLTNPTGFWQAHNLSFLLALGLVVIVEAVGAWGLVLGASPVALLVQFYHSQRKRLEESQRRVVEVEALNERLAGTVGELREALAHVNTLQGLLPICMHCKSIRDDNDTWHRLEAYIGEHTDATFTHSVCRNCQEKHYSCVKV